MCVSGAVAVFVTTGPGCSLGQAAGQAPVGGESILTVCDLVGSGLKLEFLNEELPPVCDYKLTRSLALCQQENAIQGCTWAGIFHAQLCWNTAALWECLTRAKPQLLPLSFCSFKQSLSSRAAQESWWLFLAPGLPAHIWRALSWDLSLLVLSQQSHGFITLVSVDSGGWVPVWRGTGLFQSFQDNQE